MEISISQSEDMAINAILIYLYKARNSGNTRRGKPQNENSKNRQQRISLIMNSLVKFQLL